MGNIPISGIKNKANKMYMKHVKVARITMEDNLALIKSLMLNGRRKHTYTGWLEQASMFYDNGLDSTDALTALLMTPSLHSNQSSRPSGVGARGAKAVPDSSKLGQGRRARQYAAQAGLSSHRSGYPVHRLMPPRRLSGPTVRLRGALQRTGRAQVLRCHRPGEAVPSGD